MTRTCNNSEGRARTEPPHGGEELQKQRCFFESVSLKTACRVRVCLGGGDTDGAARSRTTTAAWRAFGT
tara:strand:- start:319 stop:525 length:207 start_codon:yes stop_codon:yes gene_type:complete